MRREGATWAEARLSRFGAKAGSARVMALRHSDPKMAEAFCRTRLSGEHGVAYGPLPHWPAMPRLYRARPAPNAMMPLPFYVKVL